MTADNARRLTVAHQKPGECNYCDELHASIVAAVLLNTSLGSPEGRLTRIAEAHHKYVGPNGMTSGDCAECGQEKWPCPTYIWATTERDLLACWDPFDDGEVVQ